MDNTPATAADERKNTALMPDWPVKGKLWRDDALTRTGINDLQKLLDNQASTAGCLQIAYLSTSSMAAVQMSIRDTALELEAVDSLACATMVESKAAATRAMRALPNAFECLTDPDTATAAQPIFEEIAADAQRVEKLFFSVGEKYTACAKQLDAALTKGTLRHEELGKIVQQAEQQISVSQVYVEQSKQAVDKYDKDLTIMAKQQREMVDQQDDAVNKGFALGMVNAVFGGATKLLKAGAEAFVTASNPGLTMGSAIGSAAAGDAMKIVKDAVADDNGNGSTAKPAAAGGGGSSSNSKPFDAAKTKAEADKWIATLTKQLAETKEPEKQGELRKKLDDWKETADQATLLLSDEEVAKYRGTAADTSGNSAADDPAAGAWALAKEIGKRIIVHEERMSRAESNRHEMMKMMIENQAKLVGLAKQAEFDKPQLEQLLKATSALTKASTAVHGMALWWTHLRLLLESLSNKGNNLNRPDVLGTLAAGKPKLYFTAINTRIGPNMVEMYGTWWAVQDISEAYLEASAKVINDAANKSLYKWTAAGPQSQDMRDLLDKAVAKAAAGQPIIDLPDLPKVQMLSASAAA